LSASGSSGFRQKGWWHGPVASWKGSQATCVSLLQGWEWLLEHCLGMSLVLVYQRAPERVLPCHELSTGSLQMAVHEPHVQPCSNFWDKAGTDLEDD